MKLAFGNFVLDPSKAELSAGGDPLRIERQVYDLIHLLADNAERVVSKDEIVEKVWEGRFISDASISTCVKQARKVLGDDGARQDVIKTIHGRGFRLVPSVNRIADAVPKLIKPDEAAPVRPAKPSIAILPFVPYGSAELAPTIGDAVPAELISALSRLRWLFVTARGSSFRFRDPATPPGKILELLGVRYCLTGTVEVLGDTVTISTELTATESGEVIWSGRFASKLAGLQEARAQIVGEVITAMETHIPFNEAQIARARGDEHFDAWSHFHVGLQHMYRFNRTDNAVAARHFGRAVELDPNFARAHAGLSFTHWQDAFMYDDDNRAILSEKARQSAERGVELDPHDPFATYNMGRYHYLIGDLEGGIDWIDRTVHINPNFAQGLYAKGWTTTLLGRPAEASQNLALALELSPLDPLNYAMLAAQGMALSAEGRFEEAAEFGERGARSPGAHFFIGMIAAALHALNGEMSRARYWADDVRRRRPDATPEMFFRAFPYRDNDGRKQMAEAFKKLGF